MAKTRKDSQGTKDFVEQTKRLSLQWAQLENKSEDKGDGTKTRNKSK